MRVTHILVVDDEQDIRELVKEILEDEHYSVSVAANGNEAREARAKHRPDLVLLDVWMPDIDGISLLKEWQREDELTEPVVVMSGHGTVETAVEATRLGAYDFLEKPLSMAKLLLTVRRALDDYQLRRDNIGLRRRVGPLMRPLGKGAVMDTLRQQAEKLATSEANVLLMGEAGAGKTVMAQFIHQHSVRNEGAFVEFGLGSVLPEQMALELFGQEVDGQLNYGLLEQASGGTLFLSEVADLDLELQARLANALQAKSVLRIGGSKAVPIDTRVMASTQKDLQALVNQGLFREDLYYQLNVVPLYVPALREHRESVPELLTYYVDHFVNNEALSYRSFSLAAQNRLRNHSWPGNIRELKNLVQRLLILGSGEIIDVDEVESMLGKQAQAVVTSQDSREFDLPLRRARERFEKAYIEYHLRQAEGNVSQVAKASGLERTHLYRKMKALGINPKEETN